MSACLKPRVERAIDPILSIRRRVTCGDQQSHGETQGARRLHCELELKFHLGRRASQADLLAIAAHDTLDVVDRAPFMLADADAMPHAAGDDGVDDLAGGRKKGHVFSPARPPHGSLLLRQFEN